MKIENRAFKLSVLGGFGLGCFLLFLFLFVSAGGQVPFKDRYEVKAILPTSFNLVENSDVRLSGVKIGRVTDITNKGPNGLVTLQIDDDHKPLYKDATVLLRTKTLVGENYLTVTKGDPDTGELEKGATLPLASAGEAVQLDEILDTLDAKTRNEVRRNLDGLGPGFDGQGENVNRLFAALTPTVMEGQAVASILRSKREQTADLISNTAEVLRAFGDRTDQVRTLARQAKATAQVVAERDEQFGDAIDELDPTLRQAQFSVAKLGRFSSRATPVFRDVKVAATGLGPLMRDLRPAARLSRELFREVPPLTKELDPLLKNLRAFSPELEKAIQPLDSVLREANPALEYLAPHQREIANFFGNVGSAVDAEDSVSSVIRVFAMLGPSNLNGVLTPEELKAFDAVLGATGASNFFQRPRGNAYPLPGTIGKPGLESSYKKVDADPAAAK